ncbi:MAG: AraC family transcriptional regulator [Alphaproteobacteria bacterium]
MSAFDEAICALAQQLNVTGCGRYETNQPEVTLFWRSKPVPTMSCALDPCILVMSNGCMKLTTCADQPELCAGQYLQLGAPLTLDTEIAACGSNPLRGLIVNVPPDILQDVASQMDAADTDPGTTAVTAMEVVAMGESMVKATERLARVLSCPEESRILGPALHREVVYRALKEASSPALMVLLNPNSSNARIARVIASIKSDLGNARSIDDMAREAGMSISVFHREFKQTVGETPLSYLKKLRLREARKLIVMAGMSAKQVAHQLGYASSSHFSRDFKRHFGLTTSEAREQFEDARRSDDQDLGDPEVLLYW